MVSWGESAKINPMNSLLHLKKELTSLKLRGGKTVLISRLIEYCDLNQESEDTLSSAGDDGRACETAMAEWRMNEENDGEHRKAVDEIELEKFRRVNESGFSALKTLLLVAGGSGAAFLALLGRLWPHANDGIKAELSTGLLFLCLFGSRGHASVRLGLLVPPLLS